MSDNDKDKKEPAATPAAGAGAAAKPAAPATPATSAGAAPARPAAKPAAGDDVSRRAFLSTLGFAWWVAFSAAMGACTAGLGRFFFPNVLYEPPSQFKAGFPEEYTIGAVDERYKPSFGVWIVRSAEGFFALRSVCTHLGCTPNWLSAEQKFKCPCHGSGFYITGINFEGPAPRPLERYKIALAADGQLLVDKSRIYQFEKGQWSDPDSFLKMA
jgi:cytochrome b6-f complex iron-sulfur subunit